RDAGYKWVSKWRLAYTNWAAEEPRHNTACVYLDIDGYWKTGNCSEKYYSVCERYNGEWMWQDKSNIAFVNWNKPDDHRENDRSETLIIEESAVSTTKISGHLGTNHRIAAISITDIIHTMTKLDTKKNQEHIKQIGAVSHFKETL
ncbi:hypothetical protein L345_14539, partial [Ophiophagus hannah]